MKKGKNYRRKCKKGFSINENISLLDMNVNKIYNMDCIEGMKKIIKENSIDLVITDPPFAIDFKAKRNNYNRTQSRVLEGYQEIPKEKYYEFTIKWIKEAYKFEM